MNISRVLFSKKIRELCLVGVFTLFLIPYSFNLNGEGLSSNYLFIAFPIIIILLKNQIIIPPRFYLVIIFLYLIIFLLASTYQYEYYKYLDRRVTSFILFISFLPYLFIRISSNLIDVFKKAIVFFQYYSLS